MLVEEHRLFFFDGPSFDSLLASSRSPGEWWARGIRSLSDLHGTRVARSEGRRRRRCENPAQCLASESLVGETIDLLQTRLSSLGVAVEPGC